MIPDHETPAEKEIDWDEYGRAVERAMEAGHPITPAEILRRMELSMRALPIKDFPEKDW